MNRAAIYARTAEASPERVRQQLERCSEAAKRLGLVVDADGQFHDDGVSGLLLPALRPAYQRLEEFLATANCTAIVVDEASRLSRSVGHLAALLDDYEQRGVRVLAAETGTKVSLPLCMRVTGTACR